jgi:ribosomal protein S3AE
VVDVKTKDGETIRVKVVAVTAGKVSATTKKNLGKKIVEEIIANLSPLTFDEAMKDILYERVASKILAKVKSITSMRRIEINKTERKEVFG